MHRPPWSPAHHEGPPPRRSGVRGGRPRLRATRRSHAEARLRADARGRDGGIREELAVGNEKRTPPPIRIAGAGFGRPPSFQSTPLVEGISVWGSTIERARPGPVPGKSRAEGKCETRRN